MNNTVDDIELLDSPKYIPLEHAASHTYELAEKWGRQVRNAIVQHSPVLGLEMSNDSQAAGAWSLKSGGEYRATGVGSAIVGHRSDCLVIDDPGPWRHRCGIGTRQRNHV